MTHITDSMAMRVAIDDLPVAAFAIGDDRVIRAFNRRAEVMTGWPREATVGRPCSSVFRCGTTDAACPAFGYRRAGEPGAVIAHRVHDRTGRPIDVTAHRVPLDDGGRAPGCVMMLERRTELLPVAVPATGAPDPDLVWRSPAMARVVGIAVRAARVDSTLLIQGEPGTGKELVARFVHLRSDRSRGPFVAIDGGAIPETLAEGELFGHLRGAFTDARADRKGRFAQAAGGTLLFDEIGEMAGAIQVKLLRVLEEREYMPLGGRGPIATDVRIIAATNRDLAADVRSGRFRRDLYDRLNVVRVDIPPLRVRPDDLSILVDHFVALFNRRHDRRIRGLDTDAAACLARYPFPGNVRELKNAIEHAFVLAEDDWVTVDDLPPEIALARPAPGGPPVSPLDAAQAPVIRAALRQHHGNRTRAARSLGISRNTLWRKMRALGLE